MHRVLFALFLLICVTTFGQKTIVKGVVTDGDSGDPMPYVKLQFLDAKIGTYTDSVGAYYLETYYATDSLVVRYAGYVTQTIPIQLDRAQDINITLQLIQTDFQEVQVRAPDERPSDVLHRRMVNNKPINNKEKLGSYEYEVYNKVQLDVNNIGDKFQERDIVKRMDLITEYLDSADNGKSFLPVILSESVSDFYFKNKPKKKKEVVKATRISGVENLQLNQFLGDMYLDLNIYDNYLILFNKQFISPASNSAKGFYKFYLEDSTYIDNQWCYKLRFTPKREGDMTFQGEMWIHDTTYAVKRVSMDVSPWANINYVQALHIEHEFDQVAPEIWMLTQEKMIADLKVTKKSNVYGFFGRRHSTRTNFVINQARPDAFYRTGNTVEILDSAENRPDDYWAEIRHEPLSVQEQGIDNMIDSLNDLRFFNVLKNVIYLATTGYYPIGKIEVGSAFSLVTFNPVEKFRMAFALRTSNQFSRRIELGGRIAYGFGDERLKYGASVRFNITPKKRGMLTTYYSYDIEQIGQSPDAAAIGSTFGTLLRTGPLDRLTFVERTGINLEKDIRKDVILYGGFEWKEFTALGLANYVRPNNTTGINDTINQIQTSEVTLRYRWAKNEEFISGSFDRTSVRSKYPILSIQGVFGIKDLFGADYNYQKLDFVLEHNARLGYLGRLRYGFNVGYIFGTAAYPFLKVHEGNQSYWLQLNTFNKMDFFEFISDRYVTAMIENHWDGFFLDRIPGIRKAKMRLVTTARAALGWIDDRHLQEMYLPSFTKRFNNIPYVEVSVGLENILKVGRVDVFWRLTHTDPSVPVRNIQNFGIRARYAINF
ncbi:MAG: DUF5686 and carboxypeptidase-like regulatory domain-containing protein [Crocinitomicaceae bacterium]